MFAKLLNYRVRRWVLVIGVCLALFAGVAFARLAELDDARWLWLVVPFAVVTLKRHNVLTLVLLALLFFGIGWWRGSEYMQKLAVHESFHFEEITVVGKATEDAVYGKRSQLEFSMSNVQVTGPEATPLVGNLTIRGFGEPAVYRGDTAQASGKLYPALGNDLVVGQNTAEKWYNNRYKPNGGRKLNVRAFQMVHY